MKVSKTITADIERCFEQCPYFGRDGNVMVCEHPGAPDHGLIIDHPDCDTGFPKKCPVVRQHDLKGVPERYFSRKAFQRKTGLLECSTCKRIYHEDDVDFAPGIAERKCPCGGSLYARHIL